MAPTVCQKNLGMTIPYGLIGTSCCDMGLSCGVESSSPGWVHSRPGKSPSPRPARFTRADFPILPGMTPRTQPTAPGGSGLRAPCVPHELQPWKLPQARRILAARSLPIPANSPGPNGCPATIRIEHLRKSKRRLSPIDEPVCQGCAQPFGVSPVFTALQTG